MRVVHSLTSFTIVVSIRAFDAGVACAVHSSSGRHVGYAADIRTNLPLTFGSHFTNSLLSATIGRMTVVPVTSFPPVPGLWPSVIASSERMRGLIRSMWLCPLRHPRHVPYCSRFASIPHDLYILITQSLACIPCGVPVRRGPIESNNVWDSSQACELSMPSVHIRRSTGSVV